MLSETAPRAFERSPIFSAKATSPTPATRPATAIPAPRTVLSTMEREVDDGFLVEGAIDFGHAREDLLDGTNANPSEHGRRQRRTEATYLRLGMVICFHSRESLLC